MPFNLARSYEKVEMGKEFRWKEISHLNTRHDF